MQMMHGKKWYIFKEKFLLVKKKQPIKQHFRHSLEELNVNTINNRLPESMVDLEVDLLAAVDMAVVVVVHNAIVALKLAIAHKGLLDLQVNPVLLEKMGLLDNQVKLVPTEFH